MPFYYELFTIDVCLVLPYSAYMNWMDEVSIRMKRGNRILFSKDMEFFDDLLSLFRAENHRTLVLWAFDFASESVAELKRRYPSEIRPEVALSAAHSWAEGNAKMRKAQRAILDCHAFAKEVSLKEDAALCHAIAQACSVVHTPGHAIGYPIYDLTSIVLEHGLDGSMKMVEERKEEYITRLFYWKNHVDDYHGEWASFLLR